jgi:hypothetical protein
MNNEEKVVTIEEVIPRVIDTEAVRKASAIMQEYKKGKENLENKIIENEEWWKLRHWDYLDTKKQDIEPTSAWLFNSLANKHADAMDNFPAPNILPREEGDKPQAKMLSSIIPVVHQQNDFESVYDDVWWYKLKHGCGVYEVCWDSSKLNGLGDITIKKADLLNLFWEPGKRDIQESANFFHVALENNKTLESAYPQLKEKLSTPSVTVAQYVHEDNVPTDDKSVVVDWYYKVKRGSKTILHYCKYVNDVVLFSTENDPKTYPNGWYDHGLYPFVFDRLFPLEDTPCGFGFIDVCRSPQKYIDLLGRAITQNAMANATPRYFTHADNNGINETEYLDLTKPFIHVAGSLDETNIRQANAASLGSIYVEYHNNKIEELKETSGNRDVSNGGTTSGITAASAIAAMQEAGSKLSRDMIKASYRSFTKIVMLEIELVRQFYKEERSFRIIGEKGAMEFVKFSGNKIAMQNQGNAFGEDQGFRLPIFDVEVSAQKSSPYSRMAQNEMALQFYNLGFFNPQLAEQSLACLEMMDFDRKDAIIERIQENSMMLQQMQMMKQQLLKLSQIIDAQNGSNLAENLMNQGVQGEPVPEGQPIQRTETNSLGADNRSGNGIVDNARKRVATSTSPV